MGETEIVGGRETYTKHNRNQVDCTDLSGIQQSRDTNSIGGGVRDILGRVAGGRATLCVKGIEASRVEI